MSRRLRGVRKEELVRRLLDVLSMLSDATDAVGRLITDLLEERRRRG